MRNRLDEGTLDSGVGCVGENQNSENTDGETRTHGFSVERKIIDRWPARRSTVFYQPIQSHVTTRLEGYITMGKLHLSPESFKFVVMVVLKL